MPIIAPIPRTERHLMQKTIHKTKDKNHARRLTAILMLHRGDTVCHVARTLCCARSSIGHWINGFTQSGSEGLKSLPSGRGRRWPFEHICALLRELVKHSPGDFGYQRSRWSTELLAIKIRDVTGCPLHAQPSVDGCLLPDRYGGEPRRHCVSVTHTKKKKWSLSMKHWRNTVQKTPCFTKMKWIFTSIPKLAQTGSYMGSKSALSRRVRMKSTILSARCTAVREKSATWVGTVKGSTLFICLLKHLKANLKFSDLTHQ